MSAIPTVSFGKHHGLSVAKLLTDFPEYVEWLQGLHDSGKASNHVKDLCKEIDNITKDGETMMHVTVDGIKHGTVTGSLPNHKWVGKGEDTTTDIKVTHRASNFGRFLDVMGVPPNSDASAVPKNLMKIDMESLVVYDLISDPLVELSFDNVKFRIFDRAGGYLLEAS